MKPYNQKFVTLALLLMLYITFTFANNTVEAVFSPAYDSKSYHAKLVHEIKKAQHSIDVAIYSFEDSTILSALSEARSRNVKIRVLFEKAKDHRKYDRDTYSHLIESYGIDVKYVNKVLHHKFVLVDNTCLISSSGNWNVHANSSFDENTIITSEEELLKRFQYEFEYLWSNSREFGLEYQTDGIDLDSLKNSLVDNSSSDVIFTSSNYRTYVSSTYGNTFAKVSDSQVVANKLVDLIQNATTSIQIATTHFRSRPIAEALIQKKQADPNINISVYLDQQEYISQYADSVQWEEQEGCLAIASTPAQIRDCTEKGIKYSYKLSQSEIDVRFKTYSYHWNPETASQMHNKYVIIDGDIVATGSYNYSYNSEINSMENLIILRGDSNQAIINLYIQNFSQIWNLRRDGSAFSDLLGSINSDSRYLPLSFAPLSMAFDEHVLFRNSITAVSTEVNNDFFRSYDRSFNYFLKNVDWNVVDGALISASLNDDYNSQVTYTYDNNGQVIQDSYTSDDGIEDNVELGYDSLGILSYYNATGYEIVSIIDYEKAKITIDDGFGLHSWTVSDQNNTVSYHSPLFSDTLKVLYDSVFNPLSITDMDGRSTSFSYISDSLLQITTPERTVSVNSEGLDSVWTMRSTDGESWSYNKNNDSSYTINIDGSVKANVSLDVGTLTSGRSSLDVNITSNHVSSGYGKKASVHYVQDQYGFVVEADDIRIVRDSYSGSVDTIYYNGITEVNSYNDWEELTRKKVQYNDSIYFDATYTYDGLHRLKSVSEIIHGEQTLIEYKYDNLNRISEVKNNGQILNAFQYDDRGNRLSNIDQGTTYAYTNNNKNQIEEISWISGNKGRKAKYQYNQSGQLQNIGYYTVGTSYTYKTKERNYSYDSQGALNEVSWASQTQQFKYDPALRRITTIKNGNLESSFIYGSGSKPLAQLNENGRIINVFLYGDGTTPIGMKKGYRDYFILSDIRGSVRMVIDAESGAVKQQIDYDAFGQKLQDTNPGYIPFGYAGGLSDPRIELVRFGVRDYHPSTGKWTAIDPILFASGDINFYAYTGNDPVNYIDPEGFSRSSIRNKRQCFPCITNKGGRFRDLDKMKGQDEVGHHIPQNAYNKLTGVSRSDGPALGMTKADHALTRTFRGHGARTMRIDRGLNARQRIYLDVRSIRSQFGTKYNKGLLNMIKYAKKLYANVVDC